MKKFVAIFFLLFAVSIFAQEKSGATVVDNFGPVNCDDFSARADNFFIQLNGDSSAKGYFILYGDNRFLTQKLKLEADFNRLAAFTRPTNRKIEIIRGAETGMFRGEFWIAPQDSHVPEFKQTVWNFKLSHNAKPFIINTDFDEMCGAPVKPSVLNDYLNANPGMRMHVVIFANTPKQRKQGREDAQNSIADIPANRVRYFFAKSPGYGVPAAEYWLVPKKR